MKRYSDNKNRHCERSEAISRTYTFFSGDCFPALRDSSFAMTFLIIMTLSSCVKDLIFDQQNAEKKMVVNCLLDQRRPIRIYLTETTSSTGTSRIAPISDALVELYKNDSLWLSLPYAFVDSVQTFGGYITNLLPEPATKYSVKISHPKYGIVSAEDTLPEIVQHYSCEMIQRGDSSNGYVVKLKIRFQDNGAQENFYRLVTWGEAIIFHVNPVTGDTLFEKQDIEYYHKITATLMDTIRDGGGSTLFSDRGGINGTDVEIKFYAQQLNDIGNIYSERLFVDFGEVSKVHYNYFKTMYNRQSSGLGYEDYQIYSNIQNGYGIFMTQCILPDSFDLK